MLCHHTAATSIKHTHYRQRWNKYATSGQSHFGGSLFSRSKQLSLNVLSAYQESNLYLIKDCQYTHWQAINYNIEKFIDIWDSRRYPQNVRTKLELISNKSFMPIMRLYVRTFRQSKSFTINGKYYVRRKRSRVQITWQFYEIKGWLLIY